MMLFAIALFAQAVSPLLCTLGAIQVMGLAAAGVSRLAEGTRHERICQWVCFMAILVVGGMCCYTLRIGPDSCAACAVTLTLMTLIAIVDFRD
jgi:hypothetical protein